MKSRMKEWRYDMHNKYKTTKYEKQEKTPPKLTGFLNYIE
jgi:hypothetical protein